MKIELTEVTETQKHLSFEIPTEAVATEIQKVTQGYSKSARIPGFRQGKVPATVVKQRYKDQILYDVANAMIPRLVDEALRTRGLEPVATPDIQNVVIEEGQPMTFLAAFETVPAIDPGEYTGISLTKPPAVLEVGAVDQVLERLQQRAAKWHPVEDRPAGTGDAVLMDVTRTVRQEDAKPEPMQNVSVELGAAGNPPGFDENLTGVSAGDTRTFAVTYPTEYEVPELAGVTVDYEVTVKGVRRKELPELSDDFAKEVSEVETLDALRERVRHDLQHEAEHEAEHKVRHDLLQNLAGRMRVPAHNNDGFLPEGIHYATWAEFTARFATSSRRTALLSRVHEALVHLANAGCEAVLVGGSFVTTKATPEDIDVLWNVEGVDPDELHPAFLDLAARPALKARFGVDLFPSFLTEAASGLPFPEFFQRRKYDMTRRCGGVHLDLSTL